MWKLAAGALACAAVAALPSIARAQSFPADTAWTPIESAGVPLADAVGDGGGQGRDIVGDATHPALALASDATYFYVRLRLDADPLNNGVLRPFGWGLLVDTNNDLADYELSLLVDGVGDQVVVAANTTGTLAGDPSDVAETELATATITLGANVIASGADYPLPPSVFNGTADYFLDFAVPWSALVLAGVSPTSPVRFIAGTSNNGAVIDVDVAGSPTVAGQLTAAASSVYPLGLIASDRDSDGLADSLEDANANGSVDAGETDPDDADSDNDGRTDGQEDANGNGAVDPGETNPLDADSDDGGVDDGTEIQNGTNPLDPADDLVDPDPDTDGDGFVDDDDNCPDVANPTQSDMDVDGVGDACEPAPPSFTVTGGGCATGGSPGLAVVLLVALAMARRRRVRATLLVAFVAVLPARAHAQSTAFTVERFRLASDRGGIFDVEGGEVTRARAWQLAWMVGIADDALVVEDANGERMGALVDHRVGAELVGAYAFTRWLQLGAELPLVLSQTGDQPGALGSIGAIDRVALGNLRLVPKLEILTTARHGVGLSVLPTIAVPTATSDSYAGEPDPTFAPELALSRRLSPLRVAANIGVRFRQRSRLADLTVGNEVFARLGLAMSLAPVRVPVELAITASFGSATADLFAGSNRDQVELLGGASVILRRGLVAFAAAGAGIEHGFGTPDWRALVGTRFDLSRRSRARDIVVIEDDVPDALPAKDADHDGLADEHDACPVEAEDIDSFEDTDGCPDPDNDFDAVVDADDACPAERGVASARGCPEPDRDGDGVIDRVDNCPDAAGDAAHAGCRDVQQVAIGASRIELLDAVQFETNKAAVLKASFPLLDNVVVVLAAHPEITNVRVEGHTDDRGADDDNLRLSQQRADAVVAYLVAKGVAQERLEATGVGETRPAFPNTTADGRARNRRVELVIIERR